MSRPEDVLGRPGCRRRRPGSLPVDPATRSLPAEPADEVIDLRTDDVVVDLRVREVVERAPTLSTEQVDKLRFLLPRAGGDRDAAP